MYYKREEDLHMEGKAGITFMLILLGIALLLFLILPAMGVYDWDTAGEISDIFQQVMSGF